jgi:hypothetical protein
MTRPDSTGDQDSNAELYEIFGVPRVSGHDGSGVETWIGTTQNQV